MNTDLSELILQQKDAAALLQCNAAILERACSGAYPRESFLGVARAMATELAWMEQRTNESLIILQSLAIGLKTELAAARSVLQAKIRDLELRRLVSEDSSCGQIAALNKK